MKTKEKRKRTRMRRVETKMKVEMGVHHPTKVHHHLLTNKETG
jgi:hypothetical protein